MLIGQNMTQTVLNNPTKAIAFPVVEEGINTFYLDLNGDGMMEQITYELSESDGLDWAGEFVANIHPSHHKYYE